MESLTQAVPFHLRKSPELGDGTVTLERLSKVASRLTVAVEPSLGVCDTEIPVPEETPDT